MTDNVIWGTDFGARRRQELDRAIANLVEFAKLGAPIIDELDRRSVIILHDDQFIDPPTDCA